MEATCLLGTCAWAGMGVRQTITALAGGSAGGESGLAGRGRL